MADQYGDESKKISFGFTTKKERRNVPVNIQRDDDQENKPKRPKVIAPLPNTYKGPGGNNKFTPTFVPPTQDVRHVKEGEDRFESVEIPTIDTGPVAYGLQQRTAAAPKEDNDGMSNGEPNATDGGTREREFSVMDPQQLKRDLEARKLQQDLEELPPEADLEDYERMPVEDFAMALMRGFGWKEGEGVGRNKKKVDTAQYVSRPRRLGLGAQPDGVALDKRILDKMGKQEEKDVVKEGKKMRVAGGRHEGVTATVVKVLPKEEGRSDRAMVRLHGCEETVEVRCKDLRDISSNSDPSSKQPTESGVKPPSERDAGPSSRQGPRSEHWDELHSGGSLGEQATRNKSNGHGHGHQHVRKDRQRERASSSSEEEEVDRRREEGPSHPPVPASKLWLASHIRVKIVGDAYKKAKGGRLYLKKGTIVDVQPKGYCLVRVDQPSDTVRMHQNDLETVIPKQSNSVVLIVAGEHKHQKAKLLQRNEEMAAVQLLGELEVVRVALDDVAEYAGPVDED